MLSGGCPEESALERNGMWRVPRTESISLQEYVKEPVKYEFRLQCIQALHLFPKRHYALVCR